jgi:pyrroloquinoline quinone (PQQ) biosynthesis protein C
MKVDWARALGISDQELLDYRAMPESIGSVFTTLYYMRRSYEEGLAAFGWAGERFAASTNYARMMYEGLRDHYGLEVENFKVHAYAEADHGNAADFLLRQVATSAGQQRRIRRAVEHVLVCRNARTAALNRWLDEPGALRTKAKRAARR